MEDSVSQCLIVIACHYLVYVGVKFIDLFAGIGGFHAAGTSFNWKCVFANEFDPAAARIYKQNWGLDPLGNIYDFTSKSRTISAIPNHDVLFAGFPCQPFSKSGKQMGMSDERGSFFIDIAKIVKIKNPTLVVLENVRNLAGPRHWYEWDLIITSLRRLGYRVSSIPFVVSPHRIPPNYGGTPQARERVFIVATKIPDSLKNVGLHKDDTEIDFPREFEDWDPKNWNLVRDLPLKDRKLEQRNYGITMEEAKIISIWDNFLKIMVSERSGVRLPGFPLWSDIWGTKPIYEFDDDAPDWKKSFEQKNYEFYVEHKQAIDFWLRRNPDIRSLPPSRRKLEWQAQEMKSLWNGLIHFRPSGIRVKKPNYVPALVAISQTTIVGPFKRRISPQEGARLQGLPSNFSFEGQADSQSYKQLGNGVSVGAVYQVIKATAVRDKELLSIENTALYKSIIRAPMRPEM